MRILDLLHAHLDGVNRLVDLTPEGIDLAGQVHLPGQVRYERDVKGPYGEGDLVAVVLGSHPELHTDESAAHDALRSLTTGARALLLAGADGREFAFHRLLADSVEQSLQVRQVAGFERLWPRTGVVLQAVDRATLPAGYYGSAVKASGGDEDRAWLRVHNEFVLSDYVARGMRAALLDLEDAQRRLQAKAQETGGEGVSGLRRRNGELSAAVRDTEGRLRRAERQIATIESSTSMRVGRAVVGAARHPGRSSLHLPRNLYRSWRARGHRPVGAPTNQRSGETEDSTLASRLFLAHTALAPQPRNKLVVAGVLTDRTATLLDPSCHLVRLLPNDAVALVERTDPDLVLVEAAAARPGEPWAHLAGPYAPERTRELLAAVDAAHSADRPVVLWRNVPHAEVPGLVRLAGRFDLVTHDDHGDASRVHWSPGVQLGLYNPVGSADREGVVARGSLDPRQSPRDRRAVEELLVAAAGGTGLRVLPDPAVLDPLPWPETARTSVERGAGRRAGAEALRCAVVGTAQPLLGAPTLSDEALEVLASGARVVVARGGQGVVPHDCFADLVHTVGDTDPAEDVVADALAAGAPTPVEVRRALRRLVAEHSVPARLAWLAQVLDLGSAPAAPGVIVLAAVTGTEELHALAGDLLRQRARPDELVLDAAADVAVGHVRSELEDAGIAVRPPAGVGGVSSTSGTNCEWAVTWEGAPRGWAPERLEDLRAAAQMVEADAIGWRDGCELQFVDAMPWGGSLVRTSAVTRWGVPDDGNLGGWWRRGARLLALDPAVSRQATETEDV